MYGNGPFARFRAGEGIAAHVAVSDYGAIAYTAAFGVLRDAASAESIAARVIAMGLAGGDVPAGDPISERIWVVATARAEAIAFARASRKGRFSRGRAQDTAAGPVPEAWVGEAIDVEVAHASFGALPIAARDALSLAYGTGMQPAAIGKRIGFTPDEARELLREGLIEVENALAGSTP